MKGFFITATDTGVGKTLITSALGLALKERGWDIALWKPAQSGCLPGDPASDGEVLRRRTGLPVFVDYDLADPLAPLAAARRAGISIDPLRWVERWRALQERYEMVLVEGAGGLAVPLAEGMEVGDLAKALGLPLIVAARSALGTVNHILLTLRWAKAIGLTTAGVVMNGFGSGDPLAEETNPRLMAEFTDVPILAKVPRYPEEPAPDKLLQVGEDILARLGVPESRK